MPDPARRYLNMLMISPPIPDYAYAVRCQRVFGYAYAMRWQRLKVNACAMCCPRVCYVLPTRVLCAAHACALCCPVLTSL
eukprot:2937618-Rhodomonas_salina.3